MSSCHSGFTSHVELDVLIHRRSAIVRLANDSVSAAAAHDRTGRRRLQTLVGPRLSNGGARQRPSEAERVVIPGVSRLRRRTGEHPEPDALMVKLEEVGKAAN